MKCWLGSRGGDIQVVAEAQVGEDLLATFLLFLFLAAMTRRA